MIRFLAVLALFFAAGGDGATLRVRAEWQRGPEMESAEIHGSGAGVWNDQVALRVSPGDVRAIARSIDEARFAAMPDRFGKGRKKIRGKVTVSTDGAAKTVVQMADGERSEALATLAAEVITIGRNAAKNGTRAQSLADGLQKVAAGALPLEALRVFVQRRDDRSEARQAGWLLHIRGREAIARAVDPKSGYGNAHRIVLTEDDLRSIVTLLRESDFATLPNTLYAPMYTDFRVDVLDRSRDLQARRYGGVSAKTHGARQEAFDRAFEKARALAQRALREGGVVPTSE